MMLNNLLLNTDSYKASHWVQYPPNTRKIVSYIESRGGTYDRTVFFGLQIFIKTYLESPITKEMIDEAEMFWAAHGEPFNRAGWEHILNVHNGYLPLKINAVPEGTVVPTRNVLVTIENTDEECFWLPSHIETSILRAVWYPTTVATISWSIKQVIRKALEETADVEALGGLPFKLHDFGARGVSSFESAGLGGAAHLVNFMGTDNVTGALFAKRYYYNAEGMPGFSIPAAEHSSITSWGRDGEVDAYRNMIKQFGGKYPLFAVVSDSYNIFKAVEEMWGGELKDEVLNCGSLLVVRPDSGVPAEIVLKVAQLLDKTFGSTTNSKGFKVLNGVRIIQGDGINEESIKDILANLIGAGFSSDNLAFGMGGALLQHCDRDTQKFAMKASAALIGDQWVDVVKDPITDQGKRSKKGQLMLYRDLTTGEVFTDLVGVASTNTEEMLQTVYLNGKLVKEFNFEEIRATANSYRK